jgi:hypothetical protein
MISFPKNIDSKWTIIMLRTWFHCSPKNRNNRKAVAIWICFALRPFWDGFWVPIRISRLFYDNVHTLHAEWIGLTPVVESYNPWEWTLRGDAGFYQDQW